MTDLCQHFTPLWVAQALVERYFSKLSADDYVIEPSCGIGSFLLAIPTHVPALGVEIDPPIAERARATGRQVITGDFRHVELPAQPTAIIGNPPFKADLIDEFLDRAYALLPEEAACGFILPAYLFQTSSRVVRYADRWSLSVELIPRDSFHRGMQKPLVFSMFRKGVERTMVGFALYRECTDLNGMAKPYRELLSGNEGPLWKAVCQLALRRLGGSASLTEINVELERNRPTRTQWWREKIRQTLRVYDDVFVPLDIGRYALKEAA